MIKAIFFLLVFSDLNGFTAVMFAEIAETMISVVECLRTALNLKIASWERIICFKGDSFGLKNALNKCQKTPCGQECGMRNMN
jgi:hypothetical protein